MFFGLPDLVRIAAIVLAGIASEEWRQIEDGYFGHPQ